MIMIQFQNAGADPGSSLGGGGGGTKGVRAHREGEAGSPLRPGVFTARVFDALSCYLSLIFF